MNKIDRQEKIREKILNIIRNESNKYKNSFQIIIWLMTLFIKMGWKQNEIIEDIKNIENKNDLFFDLGIYFNFLTDDEIWFWEI